MNIKALLLLGYFKKMFIAIVDVTSCCYRGRSTEYKTTDNWQPNWTCKTIPSKRLKAKVNKLGLVTYILVTSKHQKQQHTLLLIPSKVEAGNLRIKYSPKNQISFYDTFGIG